MTCNSLYLAAAWMLSNTVVKDLYTNAKPQHACQPSKHSARSEEAEELLRLACALVHLALGGTHGVLHGLSRLGRI